VGETDQLPLAPDFSQAAQEELAKPAGLFDLAEDGERRILTAMVQYPQGGSKVQVALLTAYAATGGGFNNYLGALRSRGLIDEAGDRLTISEAGIQALGS
jgi:hypothetical protein